MQVNYITQNPVAGAIAEHRRRQLEEDKILNAIAAQEADAIIKFRQAPLDLRRSQADTTSAESKARVAQGTEQADIDYATTRARNEGLQTEGIQSQNRRAAAEADYSVGSLPYRLTEAENQAIGSGHDARRAGYQAQSAGVKLGVDRATAGADIAKAQAEAQLKSIDLADKGDIQGAVATLKAAGVPVSEQGLAAMQDRASIARMKGFLDVGRLYSNDPAFLVKFAEQAASGRGDLAGLVPQSPPPADPGSGQPTPEDGRLINVIEGRFTTYDAFGGKNVDFAKVEQELRRLNRPDLAQLYGEPAPGAAGIDTTSDAWREAQRMARAEAENMAGYLSSDASDFAQDGGSSEAFINRRTLEIYQQMLGQPGAATAPAQPGAAPSAAPPAAPEGQKLGPDGRGYPVINSEGAYNALPPGAVYWHPGRNMFMTKR